METRIKSYFESLIQAAGQAPAKDIERAILDINRAINEGRSIFTCGNGGSALTASHFVTDWTKMSWVNKRKQLRAFCLNDNIGALTAYANDINYESIFATALESYASVGDVLMAVSGSGNSENVLAAAKVAKELGVNTIGLVGFDGGKLKGMVDICVHFKVNDMQIVEDLHLSIGHIIMKATCANDE